MSLQERGKLLNEVHENDYRPVDKEYLATVKNRMEWLGQFFRLDRPEHGNIQQILLNSLDTMECMDLSEGNVGYTVYRSTITSLVGKYRHSFAEDRDLASLRGDESDTAGIVWSPQVIGEEIGMLLNAATSDKWFEQIRNQLLHDEVDLRIHNDHPLTDRAATAMLFEHLVTYLYKTKARTGVRVAAPAEKLFRNIAGKYGFDKNKFALMGFRLDQMTGFLRSSKRPSAGSALEVVSIIPRQITLED